MSYPSFEEYTDALRLPPHVVFQDPLLVDGSVRKNAAGVPFARSGNFALTYEVAVNGSRYAVRCFHKESDSLERRYEAISRKLKTIGIGEGTVDEMVAELLASANPTIGTYARADGVHLRITAKAPSKEEARSLIAPLEERARLILGNAIWGATIKAALMPMEARVEPSLAP